MAEPWNRHLVLIVDDNVMVAELVRHVIFRKCDSVWAASAVAAREQLAQRAFEVAVVNLDMPGTQGRIVLEEMQKDRKLAGIPAIAFSADDVSVPSNVVAFLRKPIQPLELRRFVYQYTGQLE